jgi:Glycosyltransferase family 87
VNPMLSRVANSNLAGFGIAALLAAFLLLKSIAAFPFQFGIDFYQFWGVPVAYKALATKASPYLDPSGYARVLNGISDASENAKLHHANHFRRDLEPMATPFFYAVFDLAPSEFEDAQILHTSLLFLAAGLGVFMLARLRGVAPWPAVCIALLVELTFNPFVQDVRYGNVSSLQLLYMVAMLYAAAHRLHSRSALTASIFLGSLAAFVIFKPNTVWIALALAIHYAIVAGRRKFLAGTGAAALVSVLAIACGAWYFQDADVWAEWLRFTQGMNGGSLVRSFEQGNQSLPMWLAQRSMSYSLLEWAMMVCACLALALVLAMSSMGRRGDLLVPTAVKCFSDPWFALGIGILFTFATSPLVWAYYHVFALIPLFWLFRLDGRRDLGTVCATICYVAFANPLLELLGAAGRLDIIHYVLLLSWTPLLLGALVYVTDRRRGLQGAT